MQAVLKMFAVVECCFLYKMTSEMLVFSACSKAFIQNSRKILNPKCFLATLNCISFIGTTGHSYDPRSKAVCVLIHVDVNDTTPLRIL